MSDADDMDMMYDDDDVPDEEDGGEDGGDTGVEIENEYYNAKGYIEEDIGIAIQGYEKVVAMETEKGEWGFKSLKKLTKLYFAQGNNKKVSEKFKALMDYTKSAVTQ